jgi:putative oxidoreductase
VSIDLGLLILRVVLGLLLAAHGAQKLFGWFGGYGFAKTSGAFGSMMRLRPAPLWTALGGLSEFGGGLLLALGLLSPFGSAAIISAMLMAIILAHWPRFWNTDGGLEYPMVNLVAALTLAITGPGRYSLDSALGIALPAPATLIVLMVMVVIGIGVALATRASQPATETTGQTAQPAHG